MEGLESDLGHVVYISRFQVWNYKSFRETEAIALSRGINIITGQNNVGKTALLEALSLGFVGRAHRSMNTIPALGPHSLPPSRVGIHATIDPDELLRALPNQRILVPLPALNIDFGNFPTIKNYGVDELNQFKEWFFSQTTYTFDLSYQAHEGQDPASALASFPSFGLFKPENNPSVPYLDCLVGYGEVTLNSDGPARTPDRSYEVGIKLAPTLPNLVYRFAAERFNMGVCPVGSSTVLRRNAENLPEVLDVLQGNHVAFESFNATVREILPQIGRVTVVPEGSVQRKILVWSKTAYEKARRDLAFGLDDCGTGIGQVLAIIYIVVTSQTPQTILIDEPQSFLHPGAARKLIEVLKGHPEHQYIVSTHSPTIITAAQPKSIILVTHDGNESHLQHLAHRRGRVTE